MTEGKVKTCKIASVLVNVILLIYGLIGTCILYPYAEGIASLLLDSDQVEAYDMLTKLIYFFCIGSPIVTVHPTVLAIARAINQQKLYLVLTVLGHYLVHFAIAFILVYGFNKDTLSFWIGIATLLSVIVYFSINLLLSLIHI